MKRLTGLLLASAVLTLSGCGTAAPKEASLQFISMDTNMTFVGYGEGSEEALAAARREVDRLDALLDRTDSGSAVFRLNHAHGERVDAGAELCGLLDMAKSFSEATGDAFDITLAPVSSAWGFTADAYRVPEQAELDELLTYTGMNRIHTDGTDVSLEDGTEIDLGAIAKGYASDKVAEVFAETGLMQGYAALGGNVLAWGTRTDGNPWRVGVRDPAVPEDPGACLGILQLTDAYAVTSGNYERYFEQDGKRYHHIIDPATGRPAESGLVSVTIVADSRSADGRTLLTNGAMCDALSTALFVMGEEKALDFWRSGAYAFDAVLVTEDSRVLVTSGLADRFALEGSGYACETVS